jgi:putative flippase GtrA
MNGLLRWGKFNLVGAIGMLVQLGTLALLNQLMPAPYLVATAIAIELTLLHNFVWHVHFTWKDRTRRAKESTGHSLLRFQLGNGLVSIAGNLLLMRLLVRELGLPVVAANSVAILSCSLLNFFVGDAWAFPAAARPVQRHGS